MKLAAAWLVRSAPLVALLVALSAVPALATSNPNEKPPPPCVGWGLVFFDSGSASVTPIAAAILDNFARGLQASVHPSRVILNGHADRVGSSKSNRLLSRRRAEAVRNHLLAKGVKRSLVEVQSSGETRLLVETPDEVAEAQNRYVDFTEILDPAELARREAWWGKHGRPTIIC